MCCEEEQEQGRNAVNSDDYDRGGGDGGCGDGGGGGGGHDCDPGGLREVDYKVEELDLGSEHCLNCSVNAEDRMTD